MTTLIQHLARRSDLKSQAFTDPVNKFRVSQPQTLIDTDFEYGLQTTKWETIELVNNIPTFFARNNDVALSVVSINTSTDSFDVQVITSTAHGMTIGTPIIVTATESSTADGAFVVTKIVSDFQFYYKAKKKQTQTRNIFDSFSTYVFLGQLYQGTQYNLESIGNVTTDGATPISRITVDTLNPHGFNVDTGFILSKTVGIKEAGFDASLVDPNENITTTRTLHTSNETELLGYLNKPVVPYDWQGLYSVFISSNQVNTGTDTIETSHNFVVDDFVVYVPPVGDTPIGGLTNFSAYQILSTTSTSFTLSPVQNTFTSVSYNAPQTSTASSGENNWFKSPLTSRFTRIGDPNQAYNSTSVIQHTWPSPVSNVLAINFSSVPINTDHPGRGFTVAAEILVNGSWVEIRRWVDTVIFVSQIGTHTLAVASTIGGFRLRWVSGSYRYANVFGFVGTNPGRYDLSVSSPSSTVNLTSQGSSTFGVHAFMLAYRVTQLSNNSANIICTYKNNDVRMTLANNNSVYVVGPGGGNTSFVNSINNYSFVNYREYQIASITTGVSSSTIVLKYNGTNVVVASQQITGNVFLLPGVLLSGYNSFYIPSHGFSANAAVQYSVVSGTGPVGLTNGTTYYVESVDINRFRVKASTISTSIDIASVGNGQLSFSSLANNPNKNTIYLPNHGITNGTVVKYVNPYFPNSNIGGLSSGTSYYVVNATQDRFSVSTTSSTANTVDITSSGFGEHKVTITEISGLDGSYNIVEIPNDHTFVLEAPFTIPPQLFGVTPQRNIDLVNNTFYFANHSLANGAPVVYSDLGNTPLGGLTTSTTYYIIRVDNNNIRLATSLQNAINNSAVTITSVGSGEHALYSSNVSGEILSSGFMAFTSNSTFIQGSNTNFVSQFRPGDIIHTIVHSTTNIVSPSILSVDTTLNTITFAASHAFTNGNPVIYTSGGQLIGGLLDSGIYYTDVQTSTVIKLKTTLGGVDADLTSSGNGTFTLKTVGSVFETQVVNVRNNTLMLVKDAPQVTRTGLRYFVTTSVYPKADGFALHRPYDGGVELIPAKNSDSQIIRQTRKYFRYQSGKGIQVSLAINFSAPTEIDVMYRDGILAYVTSKKPHRLSPGVSIRIEGSVVGESTASWDGEYTVVSVLTDNTFTFNLSTEPSETVARGFLQFVVVSWNNSTIRAGLYDEQNGMFYEYDGTKLYAVRRSSVKQLSGTAKLIFNSSYVEGVSTNFTSQLVLGDMVVIKGQSYKVVSVVNDNTLYIQPVYRGATATNVIITKTIDTRIPQENWSLDPCDGTGPIGYNLDIHKIQMAYIDYSWYGAGKVRFGFKDQNGEVRYVHEFKHNNNFTEAYFRSGNLPCRYEVANRGFPTFVPALMHWGTSVIMDGRFDDDKAYLFTAAGNILSISGSDSFTFPASTENPPRLVTVYDSSSRQNVLAYRLVTTTAQLSVVQNIRSGTQVSATFLQTGTVTVAQPERSGANVYVYIDKLPTTQTTPATVTVGNPSYVIPSLIPLLSIRLAPSVDNSRPGTVGLREVINRMQLSLQTVGILNTHDCEIKLMLNGFINNQNFQRVTPPSLCQLVYHSLDDKLEGGTQVFNFRSSGGSPDSTGKRTAVSNTYELTELVDLGNSILGGDGIFPDGPDLLTICATILDTSGISPSAPLSITARVTWKESQA